MNNNILIIILVLLIITLFINNINSLDCNGTATYKITFVGQWTSKRHPLKYPNSAHYSPLVGGTHSSLDGCGNTIDCSKLPIVGEKASNGVQDVAETGSTTTFLNNLKNLDIIKDYGVSSGGSSGTGKMTLTLKANSEKHFLTLISMIAPSPDWLVMFNNIDLCNSDTGLWKRSFSKTSKAYDAGTDSGSSFTSSNSPGENKNIRSISCGKNFCKKNKKFKTLGYIKIKLTKSNDPIPCKNRKNKTDCLIVDTFTCKWTKKKRKKVCKNL